MQQETLSLAPPPSPFGSLNSANSRKINDKVNKNDVAAIVYKVKHYR
jgi:hypothetical protein